MPPFVARFGDRDGSHALLEWAGPRGSIPGVLAGLTDKPPGSYAPGDQWWPSVGCGPLGEYWALWWTEPDVSARRGGMVRSQVVLWPLTEMADVSDLGRFLSKLSDLPSMPEVSSERLVAVAGALVECDGPCPVVVGLDDWPGILAALWGRLWPAARPAFSARVAMSPPQGGESVAPPWLFAVPSERASQWSSNRLVGAASVPAKPSRAAAWWAGSPDSVLDEVLADFALTADIASLQGAARVAERLECFRSSRDAQSAVDLIRTLVALDASPDGLGRLKLEALDALEQRLNRASATLVLSLANLDQGSLPGRRIPARAVSAWVNENAQNLGSDETTWMLSRLRPPQSSVWWREAVAGGLAKGLARPDRAWASAALRWLAWPEYDDVTGEVVPATGEVQEALLTQARMSNPGAEDLRKLLHSASKRSWSRLHAWLLSRLFPPGEAIRRQQAWAVDPVPGLKLLVAELPGRDAVAAAINGEDATFTSLVAQRSRTDASLLDGLDPAILGWRSLWEEHVVAGGPLWPPGVDRAAVGRALLDAVVEGAMCSVLVQRLAGDLGRTAWTHPRRTVLWPGLKASARDALLGRVAEEVVRDLSIGARVAEPEPALARAVADLARSSRPSVYLVAALLEWTVALDERWFLGWLRDIQGRDCAPVARRLGAGVRSRAWRESAGELFRRSSSTMELLPAAREAEELLGWWQQTQLSWRSGEAQPIQDTTPLTRRLAELGAELAPDGLRDLWERAGGRRGRLPTWGSPDQCWREAAHIAESGALEGGVGALLEGLLADFPHHEGLKELRALLVGADR